MAKKSKAFAAGGGVTRANEGGAPPSPPKNVVAAKGPKGKAVAFSGPKGKAVAAMPAFKKGGKAC